MRSRLIPVAVAAASALLLGLPASPAAAESAPTRVADPCTSTTDATRDLRAASFGYNAQAFQVRAEFCAPLSRPNGDWLVTFHLTSFSPEVQITGLLQDVGRYEYWSGFRFCAQAQCPVVNDPDTGVSKPTGTRLEDVGYGYADNEPLQDRAFGYDAWSKHLPSGTPVPPTIEWYAEVRERTGVNQFATVSDRVPDTGRAPAADLGAGRPTVITVTPGPAPEWRSEGAVRTDSGTLRSDSATGAPIAERLVIPPTAQVGARFPTDASGRWTTAYRVRSNSVGRYTFPGDGVNAASTSAPFHAYVRAFVSLDVPAQLRLGRPVDLRGVVRPRGTGGVDVLVKPDDPHTAYAWMLLRTAPLVAGSADTYYRVSWTPRARGRYVLFTRWRHGTTNDGGVLNGQSTYRYVTVS